MNNSLNFSILIKTFEKKLSEAKIPFFERTETGLKISIPTASDSAVLEFDYAEENFYKYKPTNRFSHMLAYELVRDFYMQHFKTDAFDVDTKIVLRMAIDTKPEDLENSGNYTAGLEFRQGSVNYFVKADRKEHSNHQWVKIKARKSDDIPMYAFSVNNLHYGVKGRAWNVSDDFLKNHATEPTRQNIFNMSRTIHVPVMKEDAELVKLFLGEIFPANAFLVLDEFSIAVAGQGAYKNYIEIGVRIDPRVNDQETKDLVKFDGFSLMFIGESPLTIVKKHRNDDGTWYIVAQLALGKYGFEILNLMNFTDKSKYLVVEYLDFVCITEYTKTVLTVGLTEKLFMIVNEIIKPVENPSMLNHYFLSYNSDKSADTPWTLHGIDCSEVSNSPKAKMLVRERLPHETTVSSLFVNHCLNVEKHYSDYTHWFITIMLEIFGFKGLELKRVMHSISKSE